MTSASPSKKSRAPRGHPRPGDRGRTSLPGRSRVSKDHPRIEALGDLDELVSWIGLAAATCARPDDRAVARDLQLALFRVGAQVAGTSSKTVRKIDAADLADLDAMCSRLAAAGARTKGFVLPGADPGSAAWHVARAVARRCERRLVSLRRERDCPSLHLLAWMNRLSECLWLLACRAERTAGRARPRLGARERCRSTAR